MRAGCRARAGNLLQQAGHEEGVARINGAHGFVQHGGLCLHQQFALLLGNFGDEPGVDVITPIGEDRVGGRHLHRCHRPRTQGHGQVGRVFVGFKAEARDPVLRVLCAHGLQHANGNHVFGLGQAPSQCHWAFKCAVVVLGLPGLSAGDARTKKQGCVIDDGGGSEAFFQRCGVDERFEAGTRLPPSLRDVVEFVFNKIKTTHQSLD